MFILFDCVIQAVDSIASKLKSMKTPTSAWFDFQKDNYNTESHYCSQVIFWLNLNRFKSSLGFCFLKIYIYLYSIFVRHIDYFFSEFISIFN